MKITGARRQGEIFIGENERERQFERKNYVREMLGQTLGAVQKIDFLGSRQSNIYRPDRILHLREKIIGNYRDLLSQRSPIIILYHARGAVPRLHREEIGRPDYPMD